MHQLCSALHRTAASYAKEPMQACSTPCRTHHAMLSSGANQATQTCATSTLKVQNKRLWQLQRTPWPTVRN